MSGVEKKILRYLYEIRTSSCDERMIAAATELSTQTVWRNLRVLHKKKLVSKYRVVKGYQEWLISAYGITVFPQLEKMA